MGPDSSKPPCKKAKLIRIEKKNEKLIKMGCPNKIVEKSQPEPKSIENFIENISEQSKLKLKVGITMAYIFQL